MRWLLAFAMLAGLASISRAESVPAVVPNLVSISLADPPPDGAPNPAPALDARSSPALGVLQVRLDQSRQVRVTTATATYEIRDPRAVAEGIRFQPMANPDGPSELFPWAEIQEIQVRGHYGRQGALTGVIVTGGIATALVVGVAQSYDGASYVPALVVLAIPFVAAGAGVGALFGLAIRRWHTVYRAAF